MEVVENKDNSFKELRELVESAVGGEKTEQLISEVGAVVSITKDAGLKLGLILRGMRDELKKKHKWYAVIQEVENITGFSDRTLLHWVDGKSWKRPEKTSGVVPGKEKPFSASAEIGGLVGRLSKKECEFDTTAAEFVGRMLEKSVPSDEAGDAEFIDRMTGLVRAVAEARGLEVVVSITVASVGLVEAA